MSNRSAAYRFRVELALWLQVHGFSSVRERSMLKQLAEMVLHPEHGDLTGFPDWTVTVRNDVTMDLSGAADIARDESRRAGTTLYASIQSRRGRAISESYVTMPLTVFAAVLAGGAPSQIRASSPTGTVQSEV